MSRVMVQVFFFDKVMELEVGGSGYQRCLTRLVFDQIHLVILPKWNVKQNNFFIKWSKLVAINCGRGDSWKHLIC